MAERINVVATRDSLSEAMHTALRKLCDSKPTSIMWNLFHVIRDRDTIADYYDAIWDRIEGGQYETLFDLAEAVRLAVVEDFSYMGRPDRAAIVCTAELFTLDDWMGYVGFLVEYVPGKSASADQIAIWERKFQYLGVAQLVLVPRHIGYLLSGKADGADRIQGIFEIARPDQLRVEMARQGETETRTFPVDDKLAGILDELLTASCRRKARESFTERESPKWYAAQRDFADRVMQSLETAPSKRNEG